MSQKAFKQKLDTYIYKNPKNTYIILFFLQYLYKLDISYYQDITNRLLPQ